MISKSLEGWKELVEGYPGFVEEKGFSIPAYSEFMPPPRVGLSPQKEIDPLLFSEEDPYGWHISKIEEEYELKPGLENIARQRLPP